MVVDSPQVLTCCAGRSEGGERVRAPEAAAVQRRPRSAAGRYPFTKSRFRNKADSRVRHLGDGPFCGWPLRRCSWSIAGVSSRMAPFVYAYFPVSTRSPRVRLHDGYYEAALSRADGIVAALLAALPLRRGRCSSLLITVRWHLERDAWIEHRELSSLIVVQAGDARFRHLHARPGAARDLADACRERYGARAWVRTGASWLTEGWLGGPGPGPAAARVGDVVLAPFEPVGFVDPALPRNRICAAPMARRRRPEMLVPCRPLRGYGRDAV